MSNFEKHSCLLEEVNLINKNENLRILSTFVFLFHKIVDIAFDFAPEPFIQLKRHL